MEPSVEKTPKQNSGPGIVFGSMAVLYALVCLCLGVYVYIFRQQIPVVQNYFPTVTPTPTATPLVHQPASGDQIFKDDFSDNKNDWYAENSPPTHLEVRNGQLYFNSEDTEGYAYCRFCPILKSPYYIQVDLSTEEPTKESYGIGFSSEQYHSIFYLFKITTDPTQYSLYKFKNKTWTKRISKKSDLIKPHPNVNTLGISLDHDLIKLYINGQIVDTYEDTGNIMSAGKFWPYVDTAGFTLILDNFYAYGK